MLDFQLVTSFYNFSKSTAILSGFLPFCQYMTFCQYAISGMIFACNSVYMLDSQYITLFFGIC